MRLGGTPFETQQGYGEGPKLVDLSDDLEIICGPLINYQRMSNEDSTVFWHGSILIITKPGQKLPRLVERTTAKRSDAVYATFQLRS